MLVPSFFAPLLDAVDPGRRRHVVREGRLSMELRQVPAEMLGAFAAEVETALRSVSGIGRVHVNGPLRRVVVEAAGDASDAGRLAALLERIEARHAGESAALARSGPEHPDDLAAIARIAIEVAADVGAFGVAVAGRWLGFGVLPLQIDLAAVASLLRSAPRLRAAVDGLLGAQVSDLVLGVAGAVAQGLAQSSIGPLVDVAYRILVVSELLARRRAWIEREASLLRSWPEHALSAPAAHRTAPVPDGPIEAYAEKAFFGSMGAFGVGVAATGSVAAATSALVGGAPRPAHVSRQAYAASLGRALAARGVVVLDPAALRLLDRIDTVVLDGRLAFSGELELGVLLPLEGGDPTALRERAVALFDADLAGEVVSRDDWTLAPLERLGLEVSNETARLAAETLGGSGRPLALVHGDSLRALVATRPVADPDLDGVVVAARRAGVALRIATNDARIESFVAGEQVLRCDGELSAVIRSLQDAGHVVLLVATGPDDALAAADLAVGVHREPAPPPWTADLLAGSSLDDARFVIDACAPARDASQQGVAIAETAAGIGLLLAFGSLRWETTPRVMSAVDLASLVGMLNGLRLARAASLAPRPPRRETVPWARLEVVETLARLRTTMRGLSSDEASRRRVANTDEGPSWLRLGTAALDELANPLTPLLGMAAAVSAAVGSFADAAMVAGVTVVDALIGAVQKVRTEDAIEGLHDTERLPSRVLRDGREVLVEPSTLVPGDVVRLEAGDVLRADCRILEGVRLEVDESSLTGESLPVEKSAAPSFAEALADRRSMLFEGTSIAAGSAMAVVVAVGDETEARRALHSGEGAPPASGVELRLRSIVDFTSPLALGSGVVVALNGLLRGRSLAEVVSSGVGLAVAAVPEGLPMVATVAQLAAARRLSARGALVRNVRAIEALGRLDVVCVDKTGTLTEGRIDLRVVSAGSAAEDATALSPRGRAVLATALRATPVADAERKLPHPTDRALLRGGLAAGVRASENADGWQPLAELPFEPARGFHAVMGGSGGGLRVAVKGAPEVVLPRCTTWRTDAGVLVDLSDTLRAYLEREAQALARRGLRVLAVAERPLESNGGIDDSRVGGLELAGFLGLSDVIRPTAPRAVASLVRAGVRVVMMTGDHPTTAETIAAELGLSGDGVVTGPEIDRMDDDQLDARLPGAAVLARLTPAHKVRVVQAYQRLRHVVGMTGDGANDAPAIRLAHVGIALGTRATSAARHAADVVITDDRIETVVDAILEGRAMWASVRDAISLLVGGNVGEAIFIVASSLISGASPLNARQLLLVNLLTDAAPAIAIALRPPRTGVPEALLAEGPEASLGSALDRDIAWRALATAGGTAAGWLAARATGTEARARTVAFLTLVGSQLGQTLAIGGGSPVVLAAAIGSAAATGVVVQTPGLSQAFGCTPIGPVGWGIAASASAVAVGASMLLPRIAPAAGGVVLPRWLRREEEEERGSATGSPDGGIAELAAGAERN